MEELVRKNRQDMARIVEMLEKSAKEKDLTIEALQKKVKTVNGPAERTGESERELGRMRRQLEAERQQQRKMKAQADAHRIANNFLESRVGEQRS